MKTIVCLMGPTASGKTQLAVELVKKFPFEIISVDSAMVYQGMDIGTAKPTADVLRLAPHRLIDFRDPRDTYSAAQFRKDALREIENIFANDRIPLLVGGTMLYFRALVEGLSDMPSSDPLIREQLRQDFLREGSDGMHQKLLQIDPVAAKRIHPNDPQRISRALEVFLISGKTLTAWQATAGDGLKNITVIKIALAPNNREVLHQRIAVRFNEMLENGLIEEVRALMLRGDLTAETPSIRSVGYRQVWDYLSQQLTFDEMRERGIIATRQLAKRQLTWLRSSADIHWFDSESPLLYERVSHFLESISLK